MKPQPRREVAISFFNEDVRHIVLYASKDALEDFKEFGKLQESCYERAGGGYDLFIDPRYDFGEVLAYIQNYNKE